MKYSHTVKVNGKIYKPNTEVPEEKVVVSKKETTTKANAKEDKE